MRMETPSETCRASYRNKYEKLRKIASCWFYFENILAIHGAMNIKKCRSNIFTLLRGVSGSELMIKKNSYKKLYTVLFYLGVFNFCTCCIQVCIVCFVASSKLRCV